MAGSGGYAITISAVDTASKTIDGLNKRLAALSAPAERFNKSLDKFGEVSGLNRVSEGIKELGRTSLDAFRSLDRMAGPLAAMTGAASIAGIVEFSRRWGEFGERLQLLGYRLNMPVDRLTALERGARLAGSSADALDSGLRSLGDTLTGAAFGRDPHAVQLFNSLGIAFKDASGNARQAADVLGDVADAIQRLPDPRTQARVVRELFGGEELLPFLKRGREGIREYTDEAKRLGGVITPDMADRAGKLWHSIGELETAAGGVANTIADKLSPRVTQLNENLANWAARNKDIIGSGLLEWLDKIGGWFERHPQLAGFLIGAAAGYKVGGVPGAVLGGVGGSMPGGPFQAPLQLPGDQPAPTAQPFSWFRPWTWLHNSSSAAPARTSEEQNRRAASVRDRLSGDLGLTGPQASGVVSNLMAESGIEGVNERNPAPGTRGGFGWAQWTGSRRVAFEQWAAAHNLNPASDEANYGFLREELRTRYPGVLANVRTAPNATAAAQAFFPYESGGDPGLANQLPGHMANAERVAGLPSAPTRLAAGDSGHVQVDVHLHGAPPGTTANVTTRGPVTAPPPRVETAMPGVM